MHAEWEVVLLLLLVSGRAATISDLGLAPQIWYGVLCLEQDVLEYLMQYLRSGGAHCA